MAWLGTWQNRIKGEIDYTKIDSDLSDFPTLIPISISAGKDNQDISAVFDELTSDANRKKIAVTTLNGTTQCYVEIERWDDANEKAELWVKVPSVSSAANTILYLYFDSDQADNTTYIGDTTDASAQSVWDSNFKGVWHMAQDPNGDGANAIKESTSNANHGTPLGSMVTADLVEGKIGKAIEFNGSSQGLTIGDTFDSILIGSSAKVTMEVVANTDVDSVGQALLAKYNSATGDRGFFYRFYNEGGFFRATFHYEDKDTGDRRRFGGGTTIATSTWYSHVATYDATQGSGNDGADRIGLFINGSPEALTQLDSNLNVADLEDNAAHFGIGAFLDITGGYVQNGFDGPICETRISDILRSDDWLKATYYSNWDDLISFGGIEHPPIDLNTEISAGSELLQDLITDISIRAESFFDLETEISATVAQTILDLNTEISTAFNISFEDLNTNIQAAAESLTDLNTEISANAEDVFYNLNTEIKAGASLISDLNTEIITKAQIVSDLNTDIQARGDTFYDLNTDIQIRNGAAFYDLNTEISVIRSKYWLDTEIEALSYARWSFNTEWNPNRLLNTEIAAKKPYTFSFKTKTGSSYVASSSEIEILLSGYSWPLRTLFLDYLRVGTSNTYNFELWWSRGQSGKNPLKNAKIKAEYTNTSYAGGYEVVSCDWLSVKIDGGASQTVNAAPLDLGDMPCDSKLDIELTVDCRDCSLSRGLVFFRLIVTGDYKEAIYGAPVVYGDGTQYFSGECDDYTSNNFICRLYVV